MKLPTISGGASCPCAERVRKVKDRRSGVFIKGVCQSWDLPWFFRYLFINLPPAEKGMACRTMQCGVVAEASASWTLALPQTTALSQKMKKVQLAQQLFAHPNEFRSLVQYWLWHEPKRDITALGEHETSGYNRKSMKRCWAFLDQTSRSFAAVIKELDGDLARVVGLFLRIYCTSSTRFSSS